MRVKGAKKKTGAIFPCIQYFAHSTLTLHVYIKKINEVIYRMFYKKRWHFNDSTEHHDWLLSDKVDILSYLLLPLAGPEEFDDDDMEKLPDRLQYLPPDKTREPIAEIRRILLQAILKVSTCTTQ